MHLKQVCWLILWQCFLPSVDYKNLCLAQMLHLILKGSKLEKKKSHPDFGLWALRTVHTKAVWLREQTHWGGGLMQFTVLYPWKVVKDECCAALVSKWLEDFFTLTLFKWTTSVVLLYVHSFNCANLLCVVILSTCFSEWFKSNSCKL